MQTYTVTDLGTGNYFGLDDQGQAIGQNAAGTSNLLYTGGKVVDLGPNTLIHASLLDQINSKDQMIGMTTPNGRTDATGAQPFLREPDGTIHAIAGLGPNDTPLAINNDGQILVSFPVAGGTNFGIVANAHRQVIPGGGYSNTTPYFALTAFGPNGQFSGVAQERNRDSYENYIVTGSTNDLSILRKGPNDSPVTAYNNAGGYIRGGSIFSSAGTAMPYSTSNVTALNDAGVAVGGTNLLINGLTQDLNKLIPASSGVSLTNAFKINNLGQILATGVSTQDASGIHTFLLTPQAVPEPSTLLIGITVILAGGFYRHRRPS